MVEFMNIMAGIKISGYNNHREKEDKLRTTGVGYYSGKEDGYKYFDEGFNGNCSNATYVGILINRFLVESPAKIKVSKVEKVLMDVRKTFPQAELWIVPERGMGWKYV